MLIYSLFRSAREGPADKQACTLFSQQKRGGAGWENLVNPSPEPGLYKGTYPSVLRVQRGRESRRQARGKPRRSRPPVSSSSSPPSPSSTQRRRRPRQPRRRQTEAEKRVKGAGEETMAPRFVFGSAAG